MDRKIIGNPLCRASLERPLARRGRVPTSGGIGRTGDCLQNLTCEQGDLSFTCETFIGQIVLICRNRPWINRPASRLKAIAQEQSPHNQARSVAVAVCIRMNRHKGQKHSCREAN